MQEAKANPELSMLHAKARAANEAILARGVDLVGFWPDPVSGKEIFSVRDPQPQDQAILKELSGQPSRSSPIEAPRSSRLVRDGPDRSPDQPVL